MSFIVTNKSESKYHNKVIWNWWNKFLVSWCVFETSIKISEDRDVTKQLSMASNIPRLLKFILKHRFFACPSSRMNKKRWCLCWFRRSEHSGASANESSYVCWGFRCYGIGDVRIRIITLFNLQMCCI